MKKRNKWILIAIGTIVSIVSVGIVFANLYVDSLLNKMQRNEKIDKKDAEISEEVEEKVNRFNVANIMLFGADNSDGNTTDFDRADATKIISLDYDNKQIKITSVQRDILIWLPEPENDWSKLNHAHWYGGPELSVKTLNYNLDLDITQYVGFNFSSFEKIVDLVGGIDIYLNGSEASSVGVKGAGTHHLNGKQALRYARIRKLDSDYGRMDRQNHVIEGIINAVKGFNVFELLDIANDILPYIETNLTNDEIKSYLTTVLTFDLSEIPQYQVPSGGYNDTNSKSYHGFSPLYLLRSYQDMVKEVHLNIYGDTDYIPSTRIKENEKKTYEKFGDFVE